MNTSEHDMLLSIALSVPNGITGIDRAIVNLLVNWTIVVIAEEIERLDLKIKDCNNDNNENPSLNKKNIKLHTRIAKLCIAMGVLCEEIKSEADAFDYVKRAITECKNVFGYNHRETALALHNFAEINRAKEHYDEAEKFYCEAIDIWKNVLGDTHSRVATGLNNLALNYKAKKQYSEARNNYKQALKIWKLNKKSSSAQVATCLSNLAGLYQVEGDNNSALKLYLESLKVRQDQYGQNNEKVAKCLKRLAKVYTALNRYEEAKQSYSQLLDIYETIYGAESPEYKQQSDIFAEYIDEYADMSTPRD